MYPRYRLLTIAIIQSEEARHNDDSGGVHVPSTNLRDFA